MCGICGIMNYNGVDVVKAINRMMDAMEHRGPDDADCKIYEEKRIALGHRRLSIIDLVAGRQPMFNRMVLSLSFLTVKYTITKNSNKT